MKLRYQVCLDIDPSWLALHPQAAVDFRVHGLTQRVENAIADALIWHEGISRGSVRVFVLGNDDALERASEMQPSC